MTSMRLKNKVKYNNNKFTESSLDSTKKVDEIEWECGE